MHIMQSHLIAAADVALVGPSAQATNIVDTAVATGNLNT